MSKPDQRFSLLNSDEFNSVGEMFPDQMVDYMGFKVFSDTYT